MCGRYITPDEAALERYWSLVPPDDFAQDFNMTPSRKAPVVRLNADGVPVCRMHVWGFQPPWAKRSWINARSETAFESRAFATAAHKRRCLVPAIGWYEWAGTTPPKQPWCFHIDGFQPFSLAGIWTARETADGWVHNFAILTRAAEPQLSRLHDRMPVIVAPDDYQEWLSASTDDPRNLIRAPFTEVTTYPVSTLVNKPDNNGPACIEPLAPSSGNSP